MPQIDDCPAELRAVIQQFWPEDQWENAAAIALLESGWNAFALNDTATAAGGCGRYLETRNGIRITSERSVGYFQINACNFPTWPWERLFNAAHNAGTAHMLWDSRGWSPWYFSASQLGLL
jgi:hypothetical protein